MNGATVLTRFTADTKEMDNATENIQKSFDKTKAVAEIAFSAMVGYVDKFVGAFVSAGVEYNAQLETFNTRLTTLTGSSEEADKILQQIKQDALTTPFDVKSLTQAESLLISTGLNADQARNDILALGDAISASGGGNEELQRMVVNLQQIKNVGKASALDIKQFAYAGIDIFGLLSDYLGKSKDEIDEVDRTYENISGALQKAASEGGKYYNAMVDQSKTYKGAMSNLQESVSVLKAEFTEGLFMALKDLIPQITELFNWLTKNKDVIIAITLPLLTFVNTLVGFFIIQKIITMFSTLWTVLMANPIVAIIALIASLVVGFIYLWNNCEGFRNFFVNLWETISNAVSVAVSWILEKINTVIDFFKELPAKVVNFVSKIVGIFNLAPSQLLNIGKNMISGLWNGMKNMKDWVINKVKDLGSSILKGLKGILGIKSPSKEFALIGKFSVLGYTEALDDMQKDVQKQVGETFGISPQLANSSALNYTPNVQVVNNISMKQDPLGQMVNEIKTFSGGSKNDYNYGMGA